MKRIKFTFWFLFVCLIAFEIFSYSTSKQTMMLVTGQASWATLLAFAFCAVDMAGLPLTQGKLSEHENDAKKFLLSAWVLTALGDTVMTWYAVASTSAQNTSHLLVQGGIVSEAFFTLYVPLGLALLVFLIQTLLVHWVNREAKLIAQ